jgi:tetratricopeptide (TPR) repeat protein
VSKTLLNLVRKSDHNSDKKNLSVRTFVYYVVAISVTTVLLAQLASWTTAYLSLKKEMAEESDALTKRYQEERAVRANLNDRRTRAANSEIADSGRDLPSASEKSIKSYRSALQLDPNQVSIRLRLAKALTGSNRNKEAVQVLKEGLTVSPYAAQLRLMLAQAQERDGAYEEALQEYKALVNADPRVAANTVSVARMLESLGRTGEALNWYERAAMDDKVFQPTYQEALKRLSPAQ